MVRNACLFDVIWYFCVALQYIDYKLLRVRYWLTQVLCDVLTKVDLSVSIH